MSAYLIDGIEINPQPTSHEWAERRIIGHDGDGFPVYAKYSSMTLKVTTTIASNDWRQYVDGATHDIDVPARDTANDTEPYTSVIIDSVHHGTVERRAGMGSTEMHIIRIVEP